MNGAAKSVEPPTRPAATIPIARFRIGRLSLAPIRVAQEAQRASAARCCSGMDQGKSSAAPKETGAQVLSPGRPRNARTIRKSPWLSCHDVHPKAGLLAQDDPLQPSRLTRPCGRETVAT